ncbi:MAG: hypothetical protein A2X11_13740 [Bacteroidetes bacterium GWE2_42_24]|nr:MAG: hypothetical protein A2X11_13740 [Bacteroidetes bacterium GWE2_42_24]OFY30118.1 MAG: hypothetical protein A2X09_14035 [Bacteroidetes bacterium GWF2_43_11]
MNYELSILLAQDGVSFSLAEPQKGKVLALEAMSFFNSGEVGVPDWDQVTEILPAARKMSQWAINTFPRTRIFVETRKSTLIPQSLASVETNRDILAFNHPLADDEVVLADNVSSGEMTHLFAISGKLLSVLTQIQGVSGVHCASSVLLELLVGQFRNLILDDKLFVHVRPRWFEVVYLRDKKLRFFNSFEYRNREDFIYFLLFVMDQLGLNPETSEVVLLGEVEKESAIYDIIYRYVRNVGFARRLSALNFPYVFDSLPRHSYFTILNTSLCEL